MLRSCLAVVLLCALPAYAQDQPGPFASFAGASEAVLNDPHDLTIGPDGRLYVADKFSHTLVVMDPETLEIVDRIGDGELPGIHDVSFGPDGRAYVAVTSASAVAIYDVTRTPAERVQVLGQFPNTEGVLAHSNGRLYVMASGSGQLLALEGTSVVADTTGLAGAHDVAEAGDGTIWVADTRGRRLVQYSQDLQLMAVLDDPAYGFLGPRYLDFDAFGRIVVADQDAHRVLMIDPFDGAVIGMLGNGTPGLGPNLFDDPEGVAVFGNEFYFSDSDNNRIVKYIVVVN